MDNKIEQVEIKYSSNHRKYIEENDVKEIYIYEADKRKENEKSYLKYKDKFYEANINKKDNKININIQKKVKREEEKSIKKLCNKKIIFDEIIKRYKGIEELIKNLGISRSNKKEVTVANKKEINYINPIIDIIDSEALVRNHKNEIIATANDERTISILKSIKEEKNLVLIKNSLMTIYTLASVTNMNKRFENKKMVLEISDDLKNKELEKNRDIKKIIEMDLEDGCRVNNEIYIFIRNAKLKKGSNEIEEVEIITTNSNLVCSFTEDGLYIKKKYNDRKNSNRSGIHLFKINPENLVIRNQSENTKFVKDKEENFIYRKLIKFSKEDSGFLKSMKDYEQIEMDLIENAQNTCERIRYSSTNLKENKFIVSNDQVEKLETWEGKEGSPIVYIDKKGRQTNLGELKKIDEDQNGNYIELEFENDLVRNTISRESGILGISFIGDTVRNKRRMVAREKLENGDSANSNMLDILSGEYTFGEMNYKTIIKAHEQDNLSQRQKEAIEGAVNTDDIFLIQGPPGAGKTTVIRRIIKILLEKNAKVLISSFQNLAVDNVIDGLVENEVIPYRFGDKENTIMKTICEELSKDIISRNNENISKDEEEKLNKYKEELEVIKYEIMECEKEEEFIEALEKLEKVVIGYTNTRLNKIIYKIDDEKKEIEESNYKNKKENKIDIIDGAYIENKLPEFDEDEEYIDVIEDLIVEIRAVSKEENSQSLKNVENLLKEITKEWEIDESTYNKKIWKIKDECKLIKINNKKEESQEIKWEHINRIVDVMDEEVENLPEFKENPNYVVVKDFREKIENNPILLEEVLKKYPDIMGTTCQKTGAKKFNDISYGADYDYVIIDEAGRSDPLDLLIPIVKGKKVILVGDHKQLPHMIDTCVEEEFKRRIEKGMEEPESDEKYSEEAYEKYIKSSIFGRLFNDLPSSRKIMLDTQYRMNKVIGDAVSELFYDGKLKTGTDIINDTPLYTGKSLVALNVMGKERRTHTKSFINNEEIIFIINKLKELDKEIEKSDKKLSVGIISFYKSQTDSIKRELNKNRFNNLDINSGTVDSFQGLENDIIFISSVRTDGIGFISNRNRLNVALSRAKKLAIIVGDLNNLRKNSLFKQLLEKCSDGSEL